MLGIQQMKVSIIFRRKRVQEGSWGKGGWRNLHGVAVSSGGKDSREFLLVSTLWNGERAEGWVYVCIKQRSP